MNMPKVCNICYCCHQATNSLLGHWWPHLWIPYRIGVSSQDVQSTANSQRRKNQQYSSYQKSRGKGFWFWFSPGILRHSCLHQSRWDTWLFGSLVCSTCLSSPFFLTCRFYSCFYGHLDYVAFWNELQWECWWSIAFKGILALDQTPMWGDLLPL